MPNILVINSGSTSVKYKVFNENEIELAEGNFENVVDYESVIRKVLRSIDDAGKIRAVGHRVVHGGDKFVAPAVINKKNLPALEEFNNLAPLHNPYNIAGIKAVMEYMPDIPQTAVFDTSFFCTLPEEAAIYPLNREIAEKYKIKRYGFHGISHKYAMEEAAERLKTTSAKINLITCHLGGGWSAAAIKRGKPIEISMGYTPMEGLAMVARSGDIDPGVIFALLKNGLSADEINNLLNRESGLKGLAGTADFKKILKGLSLGDQKSRLAFDIALHRLVKYIGAYWFLLEGRVDAIVFTGGIGAGDPKTRNEVMRRLRFLGKVECLVVKANEELMIAREIKRLL